MLFISLEVTLKTPPFFQSLSFICIYVYIYNTYTTIVNIVWFFKRLLQLFPKIIMRCDDDLVQMWKEFDFLMVV